MSYIKTAVVVTLLIIIDLFPQDEGYLFSSPSPFLLGAGGTGTASTVNDPFSFHSNPAILGFAGMDYNLLFGYSNNSHTILDFFKFKMNNASINGGTKLNSHFSVGAGLNFKFQFGIRIH